MQLYNSVYFLMHCAVLVSVYWEEAALGDAVLICLFRFLSFK